VRWPDFLSTVFLRSLLSLFVIGIAVAAPPPASPPAASNAVPVVTNTSSQKIDLPVPLGEPIKGLKIPQYDETGKLTMCLTAETARKINDLQVEFHKLKVQFDEKEEKEIIVEIPHSMLNLETKILTADSETLIQREDFEIVGQSAAFDTLARQGSFKGRVHASFLNGAQNTAMP
jgi:hypothetical protein